MSLSEISIRKPVFAWMLMAGLIVFGGISFLRMGISQLPDVDFPVVSVNIREEGAAPGVIETDVVDPIENAVMGISGVRSVTSRSEHSEGTITVEFELNRDIDLAVQDVQAKVAQIQQKLPRDVTAPTISKTNPEDQPIILLTLESSRFSLRELMLYVNDRVKDQFSMVSGVGDITLGGFVAPNLRIWVKPEELNRYNLSVIDVVNTVANEHSETPAGQVNQENKALNVRTLGEARTVEQFENLVINQRGGQPNYVPIRLKQVARVEEGLADVLRISRARGVPGVALGIKKQRGSNAVAVAKEVRKKVAEIQKGLPDGMNLSVNFDSTRYIEQAVSELNFTLFLSALLTATVCWIFLGSWSSTFNVLMSIPTSVVGTFIVLNFAGFTLNTFTLLGLSLSIGIVVDDAIMVLENIIRHQEMGKDRVTAALDGSREITFAAMAATISIVAIFLPVAFMSGVIGRFFFQFGVTITVAVLLSLLEALTLTPMRCSQFAAVQHKAGGRAMDRLMDSLSARYSLWLAVALRSRWAVVAASLAVFGLSLSTLHWMNKEFLPSEDQSRFNIRLKTPIGSNLLYSDSRFREVEKFLATRPEIDRYVLQVGGGSPGDANSGSVLVTMKAKGKRGTDPAAGHELSQQEFMGVCRSELKKIHDVRATIQDLASRTFSASRGFPVEFTIQGPEWTELAKYSQTMVKELEKTGLVTDLDTDYDVGMPELHIIPDRDKAKERAVSVLNIGNTVNAMIGGVLVGTYARGGHRYDIHLKLEGSQATPQEKINGLFVRNNRDELVPLSKLVRVEETREMIEVSRRNRERAISVFANVKAGESQQNALAAVETVAKRVLPPEYHVLTGGSSQTFTESFKSLAVALVLGLFVAYMVLGSQFNSFIDPVTVLMALPFSVSGAFVALLIAHQSLNIYSMIGLILLMGIVKKNSILLVDFTNQVRRERSLAVTEALLAACPIRLRPILMTSVATIAGALPAAFALGPGAESRIPMAVGVIGGVLVSTVLTLFVVPCVYLILSRFQRQTTAA
ncbi:MAG: efflux RND transporter permease subunit [Bdellovibrionota bacterium]